MVASELGIPGAATASYVLTNPSASTPTPGDLGASFEDPVTVRRDRVRRRQASEPQLDDAGVVSLLAAARHLRGILPRRQWPVDPGITSLDDFPTNDPSYTRSACRSSATAATSAISARSAGSAAARSAARGQGVRHLRVQVPASTSAPTSRVELGQAADRVRGEPGYDSPGEIPITRAAIGFQTIDGFQTRSPFDAHHLGARRLGSASARSTRVVLSADVFNLFNQQTVLDYDPDYETTFGARSIRIWAAEPLEPGAAADAAADPLWRALRILTLGFPAPQRGFRRRLDGFRRSSGPTPRCACRGRAPTRRGSCRARRAAARAC